MNRGSRLNGGIYRSPIGVDVKVCWQALIPGDLDRVDRALLALGHDVLKTIGFQDGRRFAEAHETPDGLQFRFETFTANPTPEVSSHA